MVPPALLAVTMVFMPQSPVFLVSKGGRWTQTQTQEQDIITGRKEEARKALLFLRGPQFNADSELEVRDPVLTPLQ